MSFNISSHKISGWRSPALASAMIFVAMACLMSSSQSPIRKAMQTISYATPKTRVVSTSKCSPSRNGVIGMTRSYVTGGSAIGLSATDAWNQSSVIGDLFSLAQWPRNVCGKALGAFLNPSEAGGLSLEEGPAQFSSPNARGRVSCRTVQKALALHVRDAKP